MESNKLSDILLKQKEFFRNGNTLSVSFRLKALKSLYNAIEIYETKIFDALKSDLGKSKEESYMCELCLVKSEISYMVRHIKKFAKDKRVATPMVNSFSYSFIKPCPYGNVLIMSPWNYPILLTLSPLINAISAGNTAIIKPSAYSPNSSAVLKDLIENTFEDKYIAVVTGGREENSFLLGMDFDYIFFTGSERVGKLVMSKASEKLIPVTLELGGKSPVIVDETADIKLSAKRIVFGKFINCGQTCIAPDHIYCNEKVKDQLIDELKKQIIQQYSENPLNNEKYGKIINEKHFNRLLGLIDNEKVVFGGENDIKKHKISPTIIDNTNENDAIMKEEIFGPLLPILTYSSLKELVSKLQKRACPLALYIFSKNKKNINYVTSNVLYGGGCINDTIVHLVTSTMPFGGVKESGLGAYHGKAGFDTFSHYKSIVDKKLFLDLPIRYAPYSKLKDFIIRMVVR